MAVRPQLPLVLILVDGDDVATRHHLRRAHGRNGLRAAVTDRCLPGGGVAVTRRLPIAAAIAGGVPEWLVVATLLAVAAAVLAAVASLDVPPVPQGHLSVTWLLTLAITRLSTFRLLPPVTPVASVGAVGAVIRRALPNLPTIRAGGIVIAIAPYRIAPEGRWLLARRAVIPDRGVELRSGIAPAFQLRFRRRRRGKSLIGGK